MVCPRCKQESFPPVDFCSRCGFSFLGTRALDAPPSPPPHEGLLGQVVNGKYRVISILGEGGFGVVYKVELLLFETGNIFALKLLHPALSQDVHFRRRFLREAGLAMALIHENTIQIREFGQTEDGQLFFTMDYCEGEPLKTVIAREGFLNVNRTLHITRQILSVMKLAHARGIIHRDLKPENIFIEKDSGGAERVKVGDFGLAKSFVVSGVVAGGKGKGARGPLLAGDDITRGAILGTPRYMSPEQALGKDNLDDRSDLYSIGVVLHEMLYGQVPGEGAASFPVPLDPSSTAIQTPVSNPPHSVPEAVWKVVQKALQTNREDRFQNADEFLGAINSLPQYTPTYSSGSAQARTRGAKPRFLFLGVLIGATGIFGVYRMGLHHHSLFDFLRAREVPDVNRLVSVPGEVALATSADVASLGNGTGGKEAVSGLFPREGVKAYIQYRKGDVLRFQSYGRKENWEREIVFKIEDEPTKGTFTGRVTPGDRTFTWIVDEKENVFYQEFVVLSPMTGALTDQQRRDMLRLPPPDTPLGGDFIDGGLRMHAVPVDLEPPRKHPRISKFLQCLLVESLEEGRVHYHYYQTGKGLVGIEVYETRPNDNATPLPGNRERPVYARYLVEVTHAEAPEEALEDVSEDAPEDVSEDAPSGN
ncbi:MAG TPA: serine/threonine-protein kinase [Planctomycetota bacterium]|nr:serine/threonine-protein kinase [Planctomycetota bacterium]